VPSRECREWTRRAAGSAAVARQPREYNAALTSSAAASRRGVHIKQSHLALQKQHYYSRTQHSRLSMSSISYTFRRLSKTPMIPPDASTLPMEVQMVTFRDYSAPLADARHSVSDLAHVLYLDGALTCAQRSNSTSSIMTEADELAQTPVPNVYTPWTRL